MSFDRRGLWRKNLRVVWLAFGAAMVLAITPHIAVGQAQGCYDCDPELLECEETEGWGGEDPDCRFFEVCNPPEPCDDACEVKGDVCGPPQALA